MAGDDDRIAERLKEVEEADDEDDRRDRGASDDDAGLDDGEITIDSGEDSAEGEITIGSNGDEAIEDAVERVRTSGPLPNGEMSVAERLGTAADFAKRASELRQEAISETERRLAETFDQDVEVVLDPEADGTLTGEIRIPGMAEDLNGVLDQGTGVEVEHISVRVGSIEDAD